MMATEIDKHELFAKRMSTELRVWRPVYSTPTADELVSGVTVLNNELFVLRDRSTRHIEVYSTTTLALQRQLSIPGLGGKQDITSCDYYNCIYVSDSKNNCIHRLDLDGNAGHWSIVDSPNALSVTSSHDILVTCASARKLKLYGTRGGPPSGDYPREIQLPLDIVSPLHAVQLSVDHYVVCHGAYGDAVHRVCIVNTEGIVVHTYGALKGSGIGQLSGPSHVAVDKDGYVYVSDFHNHRVLLLSPTLQHVRQVVSRDNGLEFPYRLCLVDKLRLLYVAQSCFDGHVTVFGV